MMCITVSPNSNFFVTTPAGLAMFIFLIIFPFIGLIFATSVTGLKNRSLVAINAKQFPIKGVDGWSSRTVSNGSRVHCMKTWNPVKNRKLEAFSYLPPLSENSIAKEVVYMIANGWVPCLKFDEIEAAEDVK